MCVFLPVKLSGISSLCRQHPGVHCVRRRVSVCVKVNTWTVLITIAADADPNATGEFKEILRKARHRRDKMWLSRTLYT